MNRMKSYPGYCYGSTRFLVFSVCLVSAILLARPNNVRADLKDQLTDPTGAPVPIQEVLGRARSKGPVILAIPLAFVFGLSGQQPYCSPQIRATNSSNAVIEELVIGIDYLTTAGKAAGSSLTRYSNIKVRQQDTHYFYQLTVFNCQGLEGEVSVVRCVYTTGEDCSRDVQPAHFGAIPLRLKSR